MKIAPIPVVAPRSRQHVRGPVPSLDGAPIRKPRRRRTRQPSALAQRVGVELFGRLVRLGVAGVVLTGLTAAAKAIVEEYNADAPWVATVRSHLPWKTSPVPESAARMARVESRGSLPWEGKSRAKALALAPSSVASNAQVAATVRFAPSANMTPSRAPSSAPAQRMAGSSWGAGLPSVAPRPFAPGGGQQASGRAAAPTNPAVASTAAASEASAAAVAPKKAFATAVSPQPQSSGNILVAQTTNPGIGSSTYVGSPYTVSGGGDTYTQVYDGYSGVGQIDDPSGALTVSNSLSIGYQVGSSGAYNLSGTGSISAGLAYVGRSGTGVLNQTGGAFTASSYLSLGDQAGSSGTYSLSGTGSIGAMELDVGFIGTGVFNQTGGTVTIGSTGVLIGNNTGGNGTYNLQGGTLNTQRIRIGASGTGVLNLNGGTLQASVNNTSFLTGTAARATINVQTGGAKIDTNGFNVTVALPLQHDTTAGAAATDGGLTKLGTGTLTLSGANTYTGQTNINAGTLALTGSINTPQKIVSVDGTNASPASMTLANGASLTAYRLIVGDQGTGTFTQNGGMVSCSSDIDLGLNVANSTYSTGTYNMNGGSLTTGLLDVGEDGSGTFNHNAGTVNVNSVGLDGDENGGNNVYNLNGGTLNTIRVTNGGNGTFNFNGGTLQAKQNDTSFMQGLTTANVQASGAKIDTNGFNVTVAQNLVHDTTSSAAATDGGLTKTGTGTLTLTSKGNNYTGPTTVNGGTLRVDGALTGGGMLTVASGGTVAGAGTISGNVSVQEGGTLLADTANTQLKLGGTLTLASTATANFTLGNKQGDATYYSEVVAAGQVTLGGARLNLALASGFTPSIGDKYFLITSTSLDLTSGMFSNGTTFTQDGITYLVNYNDNDSPTSLPAFKGPVTNILVFGNDISVTVLAVPEPGTWAMLAVGGLVLTVVARIQTRRQR